MTDERRRDQFPKGRPDGLTLLFVHQNFPSQYRNVVGHYASNPRNRVAVLGEAGNVRKWKALPGVAVFGYDHGPPPGFGGVESLLDAQIRRGLVAAEVMARLREKGLVPDAILAHPDWGEALFVRSVYPDVPVLAYAEHYAAPEAPELSFDPEFPLGAAAKRLGAAANTVRAATFADADLLQSPLPFQRKMLPAVFRDRTILLYDGVNTDNYKPGPKETVTLKPTDEASSPANAPLPDYVPRRAGPLTLGPEDEIVTYVSRTLEPFRGWHSFLRAVPLIQKENPRAHIVAVGRTSGGYGPPPPSDGNWRDRFLSEMRDRIDFSRFHMPGNLPAADVMRLFRLTRAHIFLTYPFILSYSPVEAMSCGAPLVASNTGPLLDVVIPGETALMADFFSAEEIAAATTRLLRDRNLREKMGRAARSHVVSRFDFKRVWLPAWDAAIRSLALNRK